MLFTSSRHSCCAQWIHWPNLTYFFVKMSYDCEYFFLSMTPANVKHIEKLLRINANVCEKVWVEFVQNDVTKSEL